MDTKARPVSPVHKYRILALPYPASTRSSRRVLADMGVTQECLMDRVELTHADTGQLEQDTGGAPAAGGLLDPDTERYEVSLRTLIRAGRGEEAMDRHDRESERSLLPEQRQPTARSSQEDGPSDAELLGGHIAGDRNAFGVLFARHRDRLWAVAMRTLGDPEEAADALQDAVIAAFRRRCSSWSPNSRPHSSW